MRSTKPIPVRFSTAILRRLEDAGQRIGLGNRTQVIKMCVLLFLEALEKNNYRIPGLDIKDILKQNDGRTHRYKDQKENLLMVAEEHAGYITKNKGGEHEENV